MPLRLLAIALPLLYGGTAQAAASGWDRQAHGAARLITAVQATGSGPVVDAGIEISLPPGWHTYWRTPGDAGIPPTIAWTGSGNLARADIAWPAPRRLPPLDGMETVGYEGRVVLPVAVTLATPGAALHLHAEVDYAACKDVCIPYHASLDLTLPPGLAAPGPEAALIAAARAEVPEGAGSAGIDLRGAMLAAAPGGAVLAVRLAGLTAPLTAPDLFVEGPADLSPAAPEVHLADGGRVATLRVLLRGTAPAALAGQTLRLTVVDGTRAAEFVTVPTPGTLPPPAGEGGVLAGMFGIALLGGLILNLMPCVLPVLSLKLLALLEHAGAARRAARRGLLATAAGVMACFAALAAGLIALKSAGSAVGWGIQFQFPWFLAAMALATTLFAASLWDWLPIALPGRLADAIGGARARGRLADAFLLGAFATLLAASCSAPFVGTAIGFALARGPAEIALVFTGLGLGMAAPYLLVAALPGLAAWLPRPGAWMVWLRRVLGLFLLGTAAWLLAVLAAEAGAATALSAGAALLALLAVLAWRHRRPAHRPVAAALALALAALAMLVPSLHGGAAPIPPAARDAGPWRPFDSATLDAALAGRQVVFVDVTAAWCLTCKVNERAVLDRAPVAARLQAPGTVMLRADWTRPDPAVTAFLQRFGRYGVPMDVVYGPGAPQGIALPELLTADVVLAALHRAGATP
jgi:suppressor for copper-sensitivity B